MRELALVENIQRENLNPVELAHAYRELLTVHGITHEELARLVHKSRSQITNTLRLLSLSDYAREKLVDQKITQGHAKVLLGLSDKAQRIVVDTIIGRKLSVREAEELAQRTKKDKAAPKSRSDSGSELFGKSVLKRLKKTLPFRFRTKKKSLEIRFDSPEELESFLDFLTERKK